MNEEIPSHKQACFSFCFCCDTRLMHATFSDHMKENVWTTENHLKGHTYSYCRNLGTGHTYLKGHTYYFGGI